MNASIQTVVVAAAPYLMHKLARSLKGFSYILQTTKNLVKRCTKYLQKI